MKYLLASFFVLSLPSHAMVVAEAGNAKITLDELNTKHSLLQEQMVDVPDKKALLDVIEPDNKL